MYVLCIVLGVSLTSLALLCDTDLYMWSGRARWWWSQQGRGHSGPGGAGAGSNPRDTPSTGPTRHSRTNQQHSPLAKYLHTAI